MKKSQKIILFSKNTFVSFLCLLIFSLLFSCNSNVNSDTNGDLKTGNENTSTYLKIVSNYDYSGRSTLGYIYRVGLVGYSFDDLKIAYNESKTFELNGIPGGYNNVNVNIEFKPSARDTDYSSPASIKCNFTLGKTTILTLTSSGTIVVSY